MYFFVVVHRNLPTPLSLMDIFHSAPNHTTKCSETPPPPLSVCWGWPDPGLEGQCPYMLSRYPGSGVLVMKQGKPPQAEGENIKKSLN